MRLFPDPCFSLAKKTNPPPRTSSKVIPDKPYRSLDFWYIAPHDRETLVGHIMPYMAARLPKKYLLQTIIEKHIWAREILSPAPTQTEDVSLTYLQQIATEFWDEPRQTIAKLVRLTRAWFFTLLRYTYRMRFFEGSKTYQSDFDVQHIPSCETRQYISELTEIEVYRLTRIPYKYGATFYRSSYENIKQCLAWKRFCARIQTFCDLVGLYASPEDPEQSLKELQNNLTSVMLQREWLRTTAQLEETAILARDTARHVKEISERVASEGSINLQLMEETRQQVRDLQLQCNDLRLGQTTSSHSQQCNSKLSTELQRQNRAWGKEFECLHSRIEESEARCRRHIATFPEQIDKDRTESSHLDGLRQEGPSVEALVACRWLLEHLPAANSVHPGFGNRWRMFWQSQWSQFRVEAGHDDHPLRGLVDDEKYNRVGNGLYGTLSNFLHEYGHLRIKPLHPDVQKVVDTISPMHYNSDGQIDLEAEKRRWLKSS
ncbi:hypothetical protein BU25DRAFT_426742 [Macroventuria anomochaeta]|uniref:Uncharacterized protein n=1 Tax=Macroventuria anomochaeta TaxID=301207 RepID=A0ACB6RGM4_9PLEO|nr:uncharacterized protein BU25DRAFT_426742 [Macroventuria anomochaeta]KAF2621095.1 hypothetical protein BU25DRAFT_426742 [Macroventuria anomochaeta]